MKVRRKGADDCCCNDWKSKIKELWEKYQDVVRGVKFGDNPVSWPDGDGIVQVDTEGLIDVDQTLNKNSINPVANAPVATAIESLEAKDIILEGDIQDVQGDLTDLGDKVDTIDDEIDALDGRISTVDGKVDLQNSYNAATRAIANSAQQTADSFNNRLNYLEDSDAMQDQQIAALQDADAENAKLAGDNAFTGNNSFAVNPKAAAPASGAVDTSVVNANWVSQTGDSAPNNLVHRTANETINGNKTMTGHTINTHPTYNIPIATPRVAGTGWVKMYESTYTNHVNGIFSVMPRRATSSPGYGIIACGAHSNGTVLCKWMSSNLIVTAYLNSIMVTIEDGLITIWAMNISGVDTASMREISSTANGTTLDTLDGWTAATDRNIYTMTEDEEGNYIGYTDSQSAVHTFIAYEVSS